MPYKTKITEQRRTLIVLMIDQSGSMNEPFEDPINNGINLKSKAQVVCETSNLMLMDIIARCRQGSTYKHYFDIAVIGYSGRGINTLLPNNLWLMSPSQLAYSVKRTTELSREVKCENGETINHSNTIKVWIEAQADGDTPMYGAMKKVSEILYSWKNAQKHKDAFPPTIINITDGETTDVVPNKLKKIREKIASLGTTDGEPILFNLHISNSSYNKVCFPRHKDGLSIDAEVLFDISSPLPEIYNNAIKIITSDTEESDVPYRAFSYNLPLSDFINAMQIGTSTTHQVNR